MWHQYSCKLEALHGPVCFAPSGDVDVKLRDAVENAVCIVEPGAVQYLSNRFGDVIVEGVPNMTEDSKMKVR